MGGGFLCGCCTEDYKEVANDQTDGKKGKKLKYDENFKGPIQGKARRPKDILCLLLFGIFIIIMLAIGLYSWVKGEPQRILYPTDSRGRLCGVHDDVKSKPYLQFFDLTKCASVVSITSILAGEFDTSEIFTCPTPQVCVSECPTANEFGVRSNPVCVDEVDTARFANISVDPSNPSSVFTTSAKVAALLEYIRLDMCAPYYLFSTEIARRCVPTLVDLVGQAEDVFNFSSPTDLQDLALANMNTSYSFEDLFLSVNIAAIVNGSFSQELLVAVRQFLFEVYQDFAVVWPALLVGVGVALFLSFMYICLLRWLAGPIIIIGIGLAIALIFGVAGFAYYQFYCFQDTAKIVSEFQSLNVSLVSFVTNTTDLVGISAQICASTAVVREFIDTQLPWYQYQEYTWLAIGILGTLVLLVIILILIFLGKRIAISIGIIKEASKLLISLECNYSKMQFRMLRAVAGVPLSLFYPILTWFLLVLVFIYWGVVAIFLVTASEPTFAIIMNGSLPESSRNLTYVDATLGVVINGTLCDPVPFQAFNNTIFMEDPNGAYSISIACQFDQFVTTKFLLALQVYNLFGLFWLCNFILALGEVTLAGAFASWYWAFKKPRDVPTFAVVQAFGRAILFHSGSIAFGALLIALVQIARVILGYVQKKLKGKTGKIAKALLCILQCCLWCFEKILRYINRQAYIEIAIYGYDFCTGACKAVKLLLRNILTTAIKDRIVAFLLFLGKLAITVLMGVLAYLSFGGFQDLGTRLWGRPLNYYLLPVIILVVATFLIASGFMTVYHMAVDTIFICALEDMERNNGRDKPYFMSKQLMKLLNSKNVKKGGDATDGEARDSIEMENLETDQS